MPKTGWKFWAQPKASRMGLWNNALIESVDSIRSVLLHVEEGQKKQVVLVASANSGEGKTTFACQLAGSLARAGRKTILVDFDLRRPRVHQLMQTPLELVFFTQFVLRWRTSLRNEQRPALSPVTCTTSRRTAG